MAMALSRFAHWVWPGSTARVTHELQGTALTNSSTFPDFPSGFREPDTVTFPSAARGGRRARPRRAKNLRRNRGEPRIDREYDIVIVPSDGGGCLSGSESDDSDWSIGWLEPQAPELQTDGDSESCFAVLVPCYRQPGLSEDRFLGAGSLADGSLSDGKNFVQQWLSSLQN